MNTTTDDSLKLRILQAAKARPSPTRQEADSSLKLYAVASATTGCLLLLAWGGLQPFEHPDRFRFDTSLGWFAVAAVATYGALGRDRGVAVGRARSTLVGIAVVVPVFLSLWMRKWGQVVGGDWPIREAWRCFALSLSVAAPTLATLLYAKRRGNPLHPVATGGALGAAAGAWSGAFTDLFCPIPIAPHVYAGHILPIVLLTVVGALLGRPVVGVGRVGLATRGPLRDPVPRPLSPDLGRKGG